MSGVIATYKLVLKAMLLYCPQICDYILCTVCAIFECTLFKYLFTIVHVFVKGFSQKWWISVRQRKFYSFKHADCMKVSIMSFRRTTYFKVASM